ncbi:MAG: outer membrane beta-barrel protein [Alphaproteobacteria bacterium]|nr:outer membrane beta-barrel protein [Alphaproteobacteria bacterium]
MSVAQAQTADQSAPAPEAPSGSAGQGPSTPGVSVTPTNVVPPVSPSVIPIPTTAPTGGIAPGPGAASGTAPSRDAVRSPGVEGVPQSPISGTLSQPVSNPTGGGINSPYGGTGYTSEELGITMGAFRLYPAIDVTTGVDNNVFAQKKSEGTTSSASVIVVPSLELRSQWLNHQLRFLLSGGFGLYANAPTQNYSNVTAQVDGKFEILEDFYLTPSIAFKRATEALGTPNVAFAQAPTVVDSIPLKLAVYQKFNRFFYEAAGGMTSYKHYDHSTIVEGGSSASERDRMEYEERFRFGYEVSDDIAVFIQPTFNQRRYSNILNPLRDSDGFGLAGGSTYTFSPTSSIEGTFGYSGQSTAGGGGTTTALIYGLMGSWNGYAPLTLRPNISRTISESALSAYRNIVQTVYGVDFTYLIHEAWTAIGGLSYTTAEYEPSTGANAGTPRSDNFFRGQIGFLYSLRPQISIGPVYEYTQGSSTDAVAGPSFDRQIFSVRLVARR